MKACRFEKWIAKVTKNALGAMLRDKPNSTETT